MNMTIKAEEVITALGDRKGLDSKKDSVLFNIVQKLTDKRRGLGEDWTSPVVVTPSIKKVIEKKVGKSK